MFFEYQNYIKLMPLSDNRYPSKERLIHLLGPEIVADGTVDVDNVHTLKELKDLPVELLHVVLVSHNLFLSEF